MASSSASISLDIWQFVRVMVCLEDLPNFAPHLFKRWEESWKEVDATLASLAEEDFDAYAAMMMQNQISLDWDPKRDATALSKVLERIIRDQKTMLRQTKDDDEKNDLRFESSELSRLKARLPLAKPGS